MNPPVSFSQATSAAFKRHIEDQIVRTLAVSKKTQRQVAKELHKTPSAVNQLVHMGHYESRDFPSLSTLLEWGEVTGHKLVLYYEKEALP